MKKIKRTLGPHGSPLSYLLSYPQWLIFENYMDKHSFRPNRIFYLNPCGFLKFDYNAIDF
jgi:hypothetical protein